MSSPSADPTPPPPPQGGEGNDGDDSNNEKETIPSLSPPPKAAQLRGVSAPLRTQKKLPPPAASCLPPFPTRGVGTMRCTSAPTTITNYSSYCCTKSGWQIADPSLGNMRFTDATFSALLRDSSLERTNSARVFDSWGENGAPNPQAFCLTVPQEGEKEEGREEEKEEAEIIPDPVPSFSSSSSPVTDTRGVPFCPTCKKCMLISGFKTNGYEVGYGCDQCGEYKPCTGKRWWCEDCQRDFCFNCCPILSYTTGDDPDEWECHLCHHKNGSFYRECEQCSRRRRGVPRSVEKKESGGGGGGGTEELLSYEEYHKEKDRDKEILTAQQKEIDEALRLKEINKLVSEIVSGPKATVKDMAHDWDPCGIGSFGLSSAAEAYLCLLNVTNEEGYDLTPEDHKTCRVERGVRLPLIVGDTVKDESNYENYVGTVTKYAVEDNEEKVTVEWVHKDDDEIEEEFYEEDHGDLESPFHFELEDMVRRSPEEVWLRNDAASSRDAMNGGDHPNQSSAVASSDGAKVQDDGDQDRKMPAKKTEELKKDENENKLECCICVENKPILFSELCKEKPVIAASALEKESSSCENVFFCRDCLQRHCEMTVVDTRYSAGPVRCPGPKCGRRLPMQLWHDLVSRVSLLQYIHAPRQLMAIRCPSCDQVRGLFPRLSMGYAKRRVVYMEIVDNLLPKNLNKTKAVLGLVKAWHQFSVGEVAPEETIDAIKEVCGNPSEEVLLDLMLGDMNEQYEDDMDDNDGNVDALAGPPRGLLSLVCDVERRAALALALLRKHPFIRLRCCYNPVCFKCKVDGHHEGQTCEERQAEEMEIEAQFCPQCGVPTIRSEGCRHIVCVCGAHWRWDGESDY